MALATLVLAPALLVGSGAPAAWRHAAASMKECACSDAGVATMNGVGVTGASLRAVSMVDADGARKTVGDVVGTDGKALVLFLRHLG